MTEATETKEHPLQTPWVIWEHIPVPRVRLLPALVSLWCLWNFVWCAQTATAEEYKKSVTPICEFSTIEEFWRCFCFIPKPSEAFDQQGRKILGRNVDTFSVFRKGILPEWEDPANANGSDIFIRKSLTYEQLDLYWSNLVLGMIGENLDETGEEICGCRVSDKSKGPAGGGGGGKKDSKDPKMLFRFEVWLRTKDQSVTSKITTRVVDVMTEGKGKGFEGFAFKAHSS